MKKQNMKIDGVIECHQNWAGIVDELETATLCIKYGCGESPTRPVAQIADEMLAMEQVVISKRKDAFYHPLIEYRWHGMFTLRFESPPFAGNTDSGRQSRSRFLRRLMGYLLRKWNLSKRDCHWVAATESSENGNAHVHLIFNFAPVEWKDIALPEHHDIEFHLAEAIDWLCKNWAENVEELEASALKILRERYGLDSDELPSKTKIAIKRHVSKGSIPENGIDANYVPRYLNKGLVAYVCKLAEGETQKHLEWSTPITKWKLPMGKEAA